MTQCIDSSGPYYVDKNRPEVGPRVHSNRTETERTVEYQDEKG